MEESEQETREFDILIVDDMPDNIRLLSSFLVSQGYSVRKAINGQMALGAAKALPPDLVLLDINMAGMDGYEVCRVLKADATLSHIPVIFLSAGDEVLDKVKAFQLGAVDYITKPFQIEEVLLRVRTQLTIRGLQQQQEAQNLQLQQALEQLKLAQAELIQQEKMITLRKVVAGVAHEVNNPLTFIFCNTEPIREHVQSLLTLIHCYQQTYPDAPAHIHKLLHETDLSFVASDLDRSIQSMKTGADRIRSVILTLQNFIHLDESGAKYIDLNHDIEIVLAILRHRLEAQVNGTQIQVLKNFVNLPPVRCYADQMCQSIFNLLTNAIDAIDVKRNNSLNSQFTPTLSVVTRCKTSNTIVIKIQDNGIGIEPKYYDRIFEPFFTTKPAGQGLGLGLLTSQRIIEEIHKGKLTYHSTVGEGSEFCVEIPIAPET